MYDKGKGVAEEDVEAVKWYRLAAKLGHADAQYSLGYMYDTFLKYTSSGASLNDSYKKDHSRWWDIFLFYVSSRFVDCFSAHCATGEREKPNRHPVAFCLLRWSNH